MFVKQIIKNTTTMLAGKSPNRHYHATVERKMIAQ